METVTLGGSSAAAAAGVHPYVSQVELWAQLTGRLSATVENEAMRWGTIMERPIMEQLARDGYAIEQPLDVMAETVNGVNDTERPWLVGHPDGFLTLDHRRALLEVKTANTFAWPADNTTPIHYAAQCQTYMHLTGLDRALLACLVGGQRLQLNTIERDDKAIALLLTGMESFMQHVWSDTPPPPDGSESARETVLALNPSASEGRVYRLSRDEYRTLGELQALRGQEAVVKAQRVERENILKAAMGDAEVAVSPNDAEVVRWANVASNRLDTAALKAARPALYDEFTNATQTRRFTVA